MSLQLLTRFGIGGAAGGGGGGCSQVGVTAASGWSNTNSSSQFGWRFTVGASDIEVCALRMYYNATGGAEHTMRLWRVSDQTLIASVAVTPVDTGWVSEAITPVTLTAGADYIVTHRRTDGAVRPAAQLPSATTINSAVTVVSSQFVDADTYPASATGTTRWVSADIAFDLA